MTKNKNGVKKTSGVLLIWVAAQGLPGSPRAGIMRYSLDRLAQSPNPHRFARVWLRFAIASPALCVHLARINRSRRPSPALHEVQTAISKAFGGLA